MAFMGDGSDDFLADPDLGEEPESPRRRRRGASRSLPGPLGRLQERWSRMRRKQRRVFLAVAGALLAVVLLLVFVCGRGGGDGAEEFPVLDFGNEPAAAADAQQVPADPGAGGAPVGALPVDVAAVVEATVTAIRLEMVTPTPEPTPTISVAATVRARISGPFSGSPDSNLDRHELRSAYLSSLEVDFLQRLGPDIWLGTMAYVTLQEVLLSDRSTYNTSFLSSRSALVKGFVFRFSVDSGRSSGQEVNPLVGEFGSEVRRSLSLLVTASAKLEQLVRIYEAVPAGEILSSEDDAASRVLVQDLVSVLDEYHSFMSSYGCSICGELYRSPPPGGRPR